MKLKVKTCDQTCYACPSQWNIYLEDDTYIYVRFRWGHFSANYGVRGEILKEGNYGKDGLDGLMSTEKMIEILSTELDFSNCKFSGISWE